MDIINTVLWPGEQVVLHCLPSQKSIKSNALVLIVIWLILAFGLVVMLFALLSGNIFPTLIVFIGWAIFFFLISKGLYDALYVKKERVRRQQYFITNQRVLVYKGHDNSWLIGDLKQYEVFMVLNEKDDVGDVT